MQILPVARQKEDEETFSPERNPMLCFAVNVEVELRSYLIFHRAGVWRLSKAFWDRPRLGPTPLEVGDAVVAEAPPVDVSHRRDARLLVAVLFRMDVRVLMSLVIVLVDQLEEPGAALLFPLGLVLLLRRRI